MPKQLRHYDFHVWLFKRNPLGMNAIFNPNVKCKGRTNYTLNEKPPPMMKKK